VFRLRFSRSHVRLIGRHSSSASECTQFGVEIRAFTGGRWKSRPQPADATSAGVREVAKVFDKQVARLLKMAKEDQTSS
jgi:hypothetical protein